MVTSALFRANNITTLFQFWTPLLEKRIIKNQVLIVQSTKKNENMDRHKNQGGSVQNHNYQIGRWKNNKSFIDSRPRSFQYILSPRDIIIWIIFQQKKNTTCHHWCNENMYQHHSGRHLIGQHGKVYN